MIKLRALEPAKRETQWDDFLIYMDALDLTPTPLEARIEASAAKTAKGSKQKPTVDPPPAVRQGRDCAVLTRPLDGLIEIHTPLGELRRYHSVAASGNVVVVRSLAEKPSDPDRALLQIGQIHVDYIMVSKSVPTCYWKKIPLIGDTFVDFYSSISNDCSRCFGWIW